MGRAAMFTALMRAAPPAVLLLLLGLLPSAAQAEGMNALQKAYYLSKSDPLTGTRQTTKTQQKTCDAAANAKDESALKLRLAYLEELAAKQDKKLKKLRMQLTGDDGSGAPALRGADGAEDEEEFLLLGQLQALEKGRERREIILEELLKATETAMSEATEEAETLETS